MGQERQEVTLAELSRWIVIGGLVIAGLALFFWLAPRTNPVVESAAQEHAR